MVTNDPFCANVPIPFDVLANVVEYWKVLE